MPRLLGSLPAYRHHRASGQAVVTLGGKDFYLGRWKSAASRREYERVTREWLASAGCLGKRSAELTVVELLAGWMRHAKTYYGPQAREYATYGTLAKKLAAMYGRTSASEFGPLKLKAFRQSLVDAGLARTTVNHHVSRVKLIFSWGVEQELLPPAIAQALREVRGLRYGRSSAKETEPIRPVADTVVDATLESMPPQVRAMVELQRVTGMRSGEVCIMRTCDINATGSVWTYTPGRHKNTHRGHARIVYLGPQAQEILRPWLRAELEAFLFQPAEADEWRRQQRHAKRRTPVDYGNRPGTNRVRKPRRRPGAAYTPGSYGRAVCYACELAFGLPRELRRGPKDETAEQKQERSRQLADWRREHCWHPHQLRHNAATLFRREHGLEVARVLLGHKHAAVTEIYAEADRGRAIDVAAKIG